MPLETSPGLVRDDDETGNNIKTFTDASDRHVQAMVLVDDDGDPVGVSEGSPLPVSGPVTDAELRSAPVPVSHSGLTDSELRASPVPVQTTATDFWLDVANGQVPGHELVRKYGANFDLDSADAFETLWGGGIPFTGFDAMADELIEVFGGAEDIGSVDSTGTADSGTATTLVDASADFVSDGVSVGDIVLNDALDDYGYVTQVATTTVTVHSWVLGSVPSAGNAYRVVSAASTGAAVVHLPRFLELATGLRHSEFIVLNGVTPVPTISAGYRCSRARIIHTGSGGTNDAVLVGRQAVTEANEFFRLPIGYNTTMIAADTVPAGTVGFLYGWGFSLLGPNGTDIQGRITTKPYGGVERVEDQKGIRGNGTSSIDIEWGKPVGPLGPGTDIRILCDSDANDANLSGNFTLLLVDLP